MPTGYRQSHRKEVRSSLDPSLRWVDGAAATDGRHGYSQISTYRQIVVLTEGCSSPLTAKTAISLLRYRPGDIVAVVDASHAGKTAQDVFRAGGQTPIVESLLQVPKADSLFLGTAPAGGELPQQWRPIVRQAIDLGLDVVSGLHDFLSDDDEFVSAARAGGSHLVDVRRNLERRIATAAAFNPDCLRIHTVGQDCSVGKMTTALEMERSLRARGRDAQFLATGQTGIMIRGMGVPIDCVVADFVSGAAEQFVLANQDHQVVLIEGQGSITDPRFSGVTMGLLHGCAPDGLVLCYEVGRTALKDLDRVPTTSLAVLRHLYETVAAVRHPCRVIGVAMNSRQVSAEDADAERTRVETELGLPVCDVIRHGPEVLVDAVLDLKRQILDQNTHPDRTNGEFRVTNVSA